MATESSPPSIDLQDMLREGIRIAAILLLWGGLAAVSMFGVGNIGYSTPGSFFWWIGNSLGLLFATTAVASVLIYVIARGIQLSRR